MAHNKQARDTIGADEMGTWHNLHTTIEKARAALMYTIEKVPAQLSNGGLYTSKKAFFLVASDDHLPIAEGVCVGDEFTSLQNPTDRFPLIDEVLKLIPGSTLSSVGTVGDRMDFFATIALPKKLGNRKDPSKPYLNLMGNNVGRRKDRFGLRATRMVCENTLLASLAEDGHLDEAIPHTKSGSERMRKAAAKVIEVTMPRIESLQEMMDRLMGVKINLKGGHLQNYYERVLPYPKAPAKTGVKEVDEKAEKTYENQKSRAENTRKCWFDNFTEERAALADDPNLWLAVNSVTKWGQHQYKVRGADDNKDARWYSNNVPGGHGFDLTVLAQTEGLAMAASMGK